MRGRPSPPRLPAGYGGTRLPTAAAAGLALWCIGFVFETVGDYQLSRFKADPARRELTETGSLIAGVPVLERTVVEVGVEFSRFEQFREDQAGVPLARSLAPRPRLLMLDEPSMGLSPLLVEEITRWIQRTRKIGPSDLREILQSSDMLQKLVLSGLEVLPEMQREAARVAAVIGSEFRVGELQALLGSEVDPVSLSSHLRGLAAAQIIHLSETGVDARYAFQQSLVRDILYNSLPFERRRDLHRRMADYLSAPQAARTAAHHRAFFHFKFPPLRGV